MPHEAERALHDQIVLDVLGGGVAQAERPVENGLDRHQHDRRHHHGDQDLQQREAAAGNEVGGAGVHSRWVRCPEVSFD